MKILSIFAYSAFFCFGALLAINPQKMALASAAQNSLLQAVTSGDIQKVRSLLVSTNQPDACNKNGVTPLMMASYKGFAQLVQLLLAKKANINLFTLSNIDFNLGAHLSNQNKGTTALMLAAYAGKADILYALLKAGAAVNTNDSDGQNALMYAILGNYDWPHYPLSQARKKIIELLLDFGADASACDKNGLDTAYYYSCIAGLVSGFGPNGYETDQVALEQDPLYIRMK